MEIVAGLVGLVFIIGLHVYLFWLCVETDGLAWGTTMFLIYILLQIIAVVICYAFGIAGALVLIVTMLGLIGLSKRRGRKEY